MPHKVWMVRTDGPPIYYNHSMRDFARAALELPDRASRERALFHPDDLARFVASRTQALAAERDWAIEARMRAPDQSYRWHRLNFSVLRRWGKADAWLVTATDIDDLQRALIAAQEGEEQLRLAADAAQLGIYVYDLVTGEHSWSLELKRIFGIPPDSPAPRSIADLIHPDDRARFEAVRAASLDRQVRAPSRTSIVSCGQTGLSDGSSSKAEFRSTRMGLAGGRGEAWVLSSTSPSENERRPLSLKAKPVTACSLKLPMTSSRHLRWTDGSYR